MKKTIEIFVFALACVAVCVIAHSAFAQRIGTQNPSYIIDGKEIKKSALVYDFIKIAFPEKSAIEGKDTVDKNEAPEFIWANIKKEKMKAELPWAYEYVYRNKGYPQFGTLNRWQSDLKIGIGWPPVNPNPRVMKSEMPSLKKEGLIRNVLLKLTVDLEKVTGLKVSLIERSEETPENYAHARIVLTDVFSPNNKFKSTAAVPTHIWTPRWFETYLLTETRFTPEDNSQVEGYTIANRDNSIGFSVCQIWPDFPDNILTSLLTECLARSLGLTQISAVDNTIFSNWILARDSGENNDPSLKSDSALAIGIARADHEGNEKKVAFLEKQSSPDDYLQHITVKTWPFALTEYDKAMLSILYCTDLKPGYDRYLTWFTLFSSNKCFESFTQK